jgi:hypothetical protein
MKWMPLLLMWISLSVRADTLPSSAWTPEQLMRSLAAVTAVDATFTEQKELAILQEPLITRGILRYRAPSYLKKQILQPYTESYEVDQDWLVIETPTEGQRHFQLRGYPLLRAFVEAIRATLAGDLQTLERYYQVQFQGQAAGWTLRLEPGDAEMARYVLAIVIHGQENRLLSIETLEANSDRSLMTIVPLSG